MDFIDDDWFIVKDVDSFINASRAIVFNHFGEQDEKSEIEIEIDKTNQEELDKILSFEESKAIIMPMLRKQKNKQTNKIRFVINNDIYYSIISSLNDRMISNILNGLVNKGLIDTAYDAETNDFVFWISDEYKQEEKPETD